jgi:O-antigen/teichoic acid export membrane protein
LVALLLPPFLIRHMPLTRYDLWVLILQLGAYVGFLDFGIQTAIGRFVAQANEQRDAERRDQIVTSSLVLLTGAAGLALLVVALLAWQMPHLFRAMPPSMVGPARAALLLVGASLALALPANAFNGVFVGLHRFDVPAYTVAGGKLLGALLVVVIVLSGGGLVAMAAGIAGANIAASAAQYVAYRRLAIGMRITPRLIARAALREIVGYCASLSVWQFATLLVMGLDTTLVGIFDFRSVGYYTIAGSFITVILGLQSALFGVLIPEAAVLQARGDRLRLGVVLLSGTRYGMLTLLLTGLPLIFGARPILALWVRPENAPHVVPLLQILVVANIVRLAAVPYATLLVGTGQQRLVTLSPLVEGFTNLVVSILAGRAFGAEGVAFGTLVGAVIGILFHILYNMPRSTAIALPRRIFVRTGLLQPLACALPSLAIVWLLRQVGPLSAPASASVAGVSTLLTLAALWQWGLTPNERASLRARLMRSGRIFGK